VDRDRVVLVAGQIAVFLVGVGLGVWETFLVPLHWPAGVPGLCVLLAVAGNVFAGWWVGPAFDSTLAAALPGVGWLVTVFALGGFWPRKEGDVLIATRVPGDPALGTVGLLFIFGGAAAAVAGVVLGSRRILAARLAAADPGFTRASEPPTPSV
jgi:hypothetical protein